MLDTCNRLSCFCIEQRFVLQRIRQGGDQQMQRETNKILKTKSYFINNYKQDIM